MSLSELALVGVVAGAAGALLADQVVWPRLRRGLLRRRYRRQARELARLPPN